VQQRLDQEDAPAASDPYSSVRSVDTQRKEPEKIRIWREQQKQMLEKKGKPQILLQGVMLTLTNCYTNHFRATWIDCFDTPNKFLGSPQIHNPLFLY
jgi:hypothetical protein